MSSRIKAVTLYNAALDEAANGEVILRGVLHEGSFDRLMVGDYQREILPLARIHELIEAFKSGGVPDIELGVRGEHFKETSSGVFVLEDPTYIVDGLQRVTAGRHMLASAIGIPHLGATVHFGTTEEWERDRFRKLNADRVKLSPNVLIRNMRYDMPAVNTLYQLTTQDKAFVLYDRVCWAQRMKHGDVISALTMMKTAGALHGHIGPGRSNSIGDLSRGLQTIVERTGPNVYRDNIRTFFDMIDTCWGIRRIAFKEGACYMRSTYLVVLATVLSRHTNFWRGNRLVVEKDLVRKLAMFPINDPQVVQLASASGKAGEMLYIFMVDHINSGKRTRRLVRRDGEKPDPEVAIVANDEEAVPAA